MSPVLHAYATIAEALHQGDPHAVKVDLSAAEARRLQAARENDPEPRRYELGTFHTVTATDGTLWRVATAPCSLACHCAAVAVSGEAA